MIAIEADVAHPRRGDELQHAVHDSLPRAHDRDEHQLLALEDRGPHLHERRLDRLLGELEIAHGLIAEEQSDLGKESAELRGAGFLAPHQSELVLDQRMVDDREERMHE